MLELQHIKKTYQIGDIETRALDDVSVAFREKEFVAILGPSGSGKTTCLNIIGGLDRYDAGDLIIKGKKTKDFKEKDWDAYRNNSIGFVFQSYNLIMHLSIVANVELGMTLSGVSSEEKRRRALEVLERVGLKEHLHKKPNQLSGGQMQRVAIARALANNPEILLCDEPTGALDTATSIQIMDLIKELAQDRLVIMVTHNPELAEQYADRIIRFQDGKIVSDSHPHQEHPKPDLFNLKKTSMSFFTALRLSFNNIRTKKGRTFLTAFASSIGIIGIAVILSLSTGFQAQIDIFQSDTMAEFPIIISKSTAEVDAETMMNQQSEMMDRIYGTAEYVDSDEAYLYDPADTRVMHTNVLTGDYMDYLTDIDPDICGSIGYIRAVQMNLLRRVDGEVIPVSLSGKNGSGSGMGMGMSSTSSMGISTYPEQLGGSEDYLLKNYDLLAGEYPASATDLVLVVDTKNRLDVTLLQSLGFETEDVESIQFSELVGTELKLIQNNDYYVKTEYGNFMPGADYEAMYASENSTTLRIAGVVRAKQNVNLALLASGVAYSDELSRLVIDSGMDSDIVQAQQDSSTNVMTMEKLEQKDKDSLLAYLGGDSTPYMVMLFPKSFEAKEEVAAYLDNWNADKAEEDQVVYTDLAETMSDMTSGIMDGVTIVLIAFAGISLVVSLIMIAIITYTSVLERTKEIGILKALGARKKDISRVFDAETTILGVFSGALGVFIAWLCTFPINSLLYSMTGLEGVSNLNPLHGLLLILISTLLTVLGGHIPARMAAKKDAVEALRAE